MTPRRRAWLWLTWAVGSLLLAALLGAGLVLDGESGMSARWQLRKAFLPGDTSAGHHQIEIRCESCHSSAFGGRELLQDACMRCHGAELKEARDSHPRSKFTDPRNAERAQHLDAAWCVTCHVEHRPRITRAAGLTLPGDFCVICHRDVGDERPSHAGLAFDTCASAGCHNFHDNRALYEDFLVKHARQPPLLPRHVLPARNFASVAIDIGSYPSERYPLRALGTPDAPPGKAGAAATGADWLASAHARGGVNCSGCHQPAAEAPGKVAAGAWIDKPAAEVCRGCHVDEARTFAGGKHGMRLGVGLGAMRPRQARATMKADAPDQGIGCTSCHGAHRFDTRHAAADACLGCHDDGHSRAWEQSPHGVAWRREVEAKAPAGSGLSCAGCHLPRVEHRTDDVLRVLVQHNQNDNLRPRDKMLRSACLNCHGLPFSLDALADDALVARNFAGRSAVRVKSIDMALEAERRANESRRQAKEAGS